MKQARPVAVLNKVKDVVLGLLTRTLHTTSISAAVSRIRLRLGKNLLPIRRIAAIFLPAPRANSENFATKAGGVKSSPLWPHETNVVKRLQAIKDTAAPGTPGAAVVVATKGRSTEQIQPLLQAGHRLFGENRVKEAEEKWKRLKESYNDVELHLIGPLQKNKVKRAVALFDCIETVDRRALAEALAREMQAQQKVIPCFVQINTGREAQKGGVLPENADTFIAQCKHDIGLNIVGLMCIPPQHEDPGTHFQMLSDIARRNNVQHLSMGMSADYEEALVHGATHIRVGTVIFT